MDEFILANDITRLNSSSNSKLIFSSSVVSGIGCVELFELNVSLADAMALTRDCVRLFFPLHVQPFAWRLFSWSQNALFFCFLGCCCCSSSFTLVKSSSLFSNVGNVETISSASLCVDSGFMPLKLNLFGLFDLNIDDNEFDIDVLNREGVEFKGLEFSSSNWDIESNTSVEDLYS